jgi:hypothetical protein
MQWTRLYPGTWAGLQPPPSRPTAQFTQLAFWKWMKNFIISIISLGTFSPKTESRTEPKCRFFCFSFGSCFLQLWFSASVSVLGAPGTENRVNQTDLVPPSVGASTPPQHGHIPNPAHIGPTCLHPVTHTLMPFATARPQPSAPPDTWLTPAQPPNLTLS